MRMIVPEVANTETSGETKGTDALAVVVQTQADMYELDTGTEAANFAELKAGGYLSDNQVTQATAKLSIAGGNVSIIE